MSRRLLLVLPGFAVVAVVAAVVSMASAAPGEPEAAATALVTRVTQPGLADEVSLALTAPPPGDQVVANYSYPADGSIVQLSSAGVRVVAQPGVSSIAQSDVNAVSVSLLGGEISVDAIDLRASVAAGPASASVDMPASSITGLVVLGQLITPTPNSVIPLADWGALEILASTSETTREAPRSASVALTALRVKVTAAHGGLPAGSTIEIGAITSSTKAAAPVVPPKEPAKPTVAPTAPRPVIPPNAPREPGKSIAGAPPELVRPAPEVSAQLSSGGYVFPIYGPASFGDTFGAPRADVSGGWHHGEDIFSPLGTPLLAVADGTVFSVGWNDIGGWRLWLRDRVGNEFYYAHLSAYSPLAVNGRQVKAGDVLGFMGKTGDAEFSPGPPALRDPSGLAALARIRRRRGAIPLPQCVAAGGGRLVRRRPGLLATRRACGITRCDRTAGRGRAARGVGHLELERPHAGRTESDPHRPGSEEPGRRRGSLARTGYSDASTASSAVSAAPFAVAEKASSTPAASKSNSSSGWRSSSPATLSISHSRVCGPDHGL